MVTIKPSLHDSDNFFIVYLPNLNFKEGDQKEVDQINDQINDAISDLGLSILRIVNQNPGINVQRIFDLIPQQNGKITIDMIRNSLRRELKNYIIHKDSRKTGGYYLK